MRYCFGPPEPARSPRPAATRMAAVRGGFGIGLIYGRIGVDGGSIGRPAHCPYHAGAAKRNDSPSLWAGLILLQCTCKIARTVEIVGMKLDCTRFVVDIDPGRD